MNYHRKHTFISHDTNKKNRQTHCFQFRPAHLCVFLQVQDPVNIKLSDYGISRQSFHEGALGVEGTPGYQAPEIRPGIVYDEKVRTASS